MNVKHPGWYARATMLLLLLATCVSCATVGGRTAGLLSEQRVERWDFCATVTDGLCPGWTPYARVGDMTVGSIYYFVSFSGDACIVDGGVTIQVHRGERWPCDWRRPRG